MDNLDIFTKKLINSNNALKEAFEVIAENQYNNDTNIIKNKIESLGFTVKVHRPIVVFTFKNEKVHLKIEKQINKPKHFNLDVTFKDKKDETNEEMISIKCYEMIDFSTEIYYNSMSDSYMGFKNIVDFRSHYISNSISNSKSLKESNINKKVFCFLINNLDSDLNSLFDMINISFDIDFKIEDNIKKLVESLLKVEETIKNLKINAPSTKIKMKTT